MPGFVPTVTIGQRKERIEQRGNMSQIDLTVDRYALAKCESVREELGGRSTNPCFEHREEEPDFFSNRASRYVVV